MIELFPEIEPLCVKALVVSREPWIALFTRPNHSQQCLTYLGVRHFPKVILTSPLANPKPRPLFRTLCLYSSLLEAVNTLDKYHLANQVLVDIVQQVQRGQLARAPWQPKAPEQVWFPGLIGPEGQDAGTAPGEAWTGPIFYRSRDRVEGCAPLGLR